MSDVNMDDKQAEADISEIDPVWTSSRTARQIYALGQVEKDISRLLALAASSISLLALPQTDTLEDNLPQGDERSEQFVLEANEYFERLDAIQENLRASLAHIRQSRISPRAIMAPPPGALPPTLGVGLPSSSNAEGRAEVGLQEARVARDAWKRARDALQRMLVKEDEPVKQDQEIKDDDTNMNEELDTREG